MTQSGNFSIFEIDHLSPYLEDVIRLWRTYSDTLGPFPRGAFDDYAQKRQIIVAMDSESRLVGYLTYRQTRQRVSIVHLCVHKQTRGNGLARKLFDFLKDKTGHAEEIRLTCRRDFEANLIWPRLGFQPVYEKPGRGRARRLLTIWRYQIQSPPLLAAMYKTQSSKKILAAIDANIFYDLQDAMNEETNGLTADFIDEAINLCVTGELNIEINRHADPQERQRRRTFLLEFEEIFAAAGAVDELLLKLRPFHPKAQISERDRSDLRHLAHAISGGASIFVTRDATLLGLSEKIHSEYGVNILRPCDVILHLDELQREDIYRPQRLSATGFKVARVQSGEQDHVISLIREPTTFGRNEVSTKLRRALSRPTDNECFLVSHGDELSVVYCLDFSVDHRLDVPVLRLLNQNSLSNTLARCVLESIVNAACQRDVSIVTISVDNIQQEFHDALREYSFLGSTPPVKFCLSIVDNCAGIARCINDLADNHADVREAATDIAVSLEHLDGELGPFEIHEIEKLLWPAKISDDDAMPNFVVPIRAKWAQELFDTGLAEQTLFGAHRPELIFGTENVFYRAAKPRVIKAPARVLWYVSLNEKYQGTMSVRACSYVDEVLIGKPKELFRQFRRLGVYRWEDVFEVTDRNLEGELMAFRFSRTQVFARPVPWDTLQEVLVRAKGKGSQFQSPESISSQTFLELYRLGTAKA